MDFTPSDDSYKIVEPENFPGNVFMDDDGNDDMNPVFWPKYFGGTIEYDVFG